MPPTTKAPLICMSHSTPSHLNVKRPSPGFLDPSGFTCGQDKGHSRIRNRKSPPLPSPSSSYLAPSRSHAGCWLDQVRLCSTPAPAARTTTETSLPK